MDIKYILDKSLMESGFQKGPQLENSGYYFKIMMPVFYAVRLIYSSQCDEGFNNILLNKIEGNLKSYRCSNAVCVNIYAAEENKEEVFQLYSQKGFDSTEKIHNVWWVFDNDSKGLLCPKGQPDKLNGIERCFQFDRDGKTKSDRVKIYNNKTVITYIIIAINTAVWAYMFLTGNDSIVYAFGTSRSGLLNGQIYRAITAVFVHREFLHLFFNCFSLYIFGRETERILSRKSFIAVYALSGIIASLSSAVFNDTLSIGASGAVFGIIGALAAVSRVKMYKAQLMDYFSLVLYIVISIAFGFTISNVDNFAHIGGALSGFIIEYVLIKTSKNVDNSDSNGD